MLRVRVWLGSTPLLLVLGGCGPLFDGLDGDTDSDAIYDGSRRAVEADRIHCSHHSDTLWTGLSSVPPRIVHWQVPGTTSSCSTSSRRSVRAPDEVLEWFERHL